MPTTALKGTPSSAASPTGRHWWPGERPVYSPPGSADVPEGERDAEANRFTEAAAAVAGRLRERASHSSGCGRRGPVRDRGPAEDRGWVGAAKKRIAKGVRAPAAAIAATEEFAALFTKLGGLMAERVTDLNDA